MDTSELSEHYFDENAIVYKVSERNRIVLAEAVPPAAEGVRKEERAPEGAESPEGERGSEEAEEREAQALAALWQDYKTHNPTGTLNDFYRFMASKSDEEARE